MEYTDIYVGMHPTVEEDQVEKKVTPHECRLRDISYSAPILVDVRYTQGNQIRRKRGVVIGRMPVMLRSCCCALNGCTNDQLVEVRVSVGLRNCE